MTSASENYSPAGGAPGGKLDETCINTIRGLAMDGVQAANSGHPGMPMGTAALAYVLWTRHLKHSPSNPKWADRDRFVLSAGHGSMLLYSLLHLTGYDLPLDQLRHFRRVDSLTPGHPEYGLTAGVETTTGPLGQGFATGVGMAMAERHLAARYNRAGHQVINHHVFSIAGDGDLMEGVSSEAASLAGHLKLGKLVYLYDDNHITIDGSTDISFTEDVAARFTAYGWHVSRVGGNDLEAIDQAITAAVADESAPSLIICRTHIGFGSPNKQDKSSAHGAPLGADEVKLAKERLGIPTEPLFYIPEEALTKFREAVAIGRLNEAEWDRRFAAYAAEYPELAAELSALLKGELPAGWADALPKYTPEAGAVATRIASGKAINAAASMLPGLVGGSADLAASNETNMKGLGAFAPEDYAGRNFNFGVREHAMGAALNGIRLHGGLRVFGGTFLVFSDYMKPAIRLAALMHLPVIYVFTHDSIGLGEDGPTHQPIEHLAALRAIPNVWVIRPADACETVVAWKVALESTRNPVALALARQVVPVLDQAKYGSAEGLAKGAYVLADSPTGSSDVILIGTGSEVSLAIEARDLLAAQRIGARVVSMPCWELFELQSAEYRESVLPKAITARVAVEAASPFGWERWVGSSGAVVGMTTFGASGPAKDVFKKFGFSAENVAKAALGVLGRAGE